MRRIERGAPCAVEESEGIVPQDGLGPLAATIGCGNGFQAYRINSGEGYKDGDVQRALPGFALDQPTDADAIVQRLTPTEDT